MVVLAVFQREVFRISETDKRGLGGSIELDTWVTINVNSNKDSLMW